MSSRHGTVARYNAGCRCRLCKAARRRYDRRRASWPKSPMVPAGPARRHVAALLDAGLRLSWIAKAAELPRGTVRGLIDRPRRRIHRDVERRLLAVEPVDAAPTWALVRWLIDDHGITARRIVTDTGHDIDLNSPVCTAATAAAVRQFIDREVTARCLV